ncbi:MAG: hypothetical protein HYT48_00365 [Candidatus Vogelbacteria bacterium]|nr:hypothetical protein [Candidatus Vogelbacteria bacterium]
MKIYLALILFSLSWFTPWVLAADCTNSGGNTVCVLEPSIPETPQVEDFGSYLGKLFNKIITAAAILAVLAIAWFGFQYMFSNIPGLKLESKNRIWGAVGGLILILAAYIILKEINPQITENIGGLFKDIIKPLQTQP